MSLDQRHKEFPLCACLNNMMEDLYARNAVFNIATELIPGTTKVKSVLLVAHVGVDAWIDSILKSSLDHFPRVVPEERQPRGQTMVVDFNAPLGELFTQLTAESDYALMPWENEDGAFALYFVTGPICTRMLFVAFGLRKKHTGLSSRFSTS